MTPQDRTIRAVEAKQLLENTMFVEAWEALDAHLHARALACDADDANKALRIVISQQLLAALKREFTRIVSDGTVAEIQLAEIEQKRSLMQRVIRR